MSFERVASNRKLPPTKSGNINLTPPTRDPTINHRTGSGCCYCWFAVVPFSQDNRIHIYFRVLFIRLWVPSGGTFRTKRRPLSLEEGLGTFARTCTTSTTGGSTTFTRLWQGIDFLDSFHPMFGYLRFVGSIIVVVFLVLKLLLLLAVVGRGVYSGRVGEYGGIISHGIVTLLRLNESR
jgi:hypothetical protein